MKMSTYILLGATILGLANPLVALADENSSKNTGNLTKNEENKLNDLSVVDKVNADEPIDSWMPDKALQKVMANALGVEINDIVELNFSDFMTQYKTDITSTELSLSTDVRSLVGLDKIVEAVKADEDVYYWGWSPRLYLPDDYNYIIQYLNSLNYNDFGKIIEDYLTDYSHGTQVNHSGISVKIGSPDDDDGNNKLSQNLSRDQTLNLYNALFNKLGSTQSTRFKINMDVNINLDESNYRNFNLSMDKLGIADLESILPSRNEGYPTSRFDAYSMNFVVKNTHLMYVPNIDTPSWPDGDVKQTIKYNLGDEVEYEDIAGNSALLDGESDDGFSYSFFDSDTVSLPILNVIPKLNFAKEGADVTARYVDENGKEIAKSEVQSGNIDDTYKTEKKDIAGYTFKEVQGNESGKFTDKAQTVTYVYTKNPTKGADVTVKYVDESGKEIADSETKSGNIGDKYTTKKKDIEGYTFKEVKGSTSGTLSDKAQTVTYVYAKNGDSENPTDPSEPAKPDTPDNSGDTDNPVTNNDSNDADKTTDSNSTIKNVVNNVVEGAQTLLPKTAAEKLTLTGVLIAVVVSLAGIIILNKRK